MASVRPEVKKLFDRISELLANATDAAGQTDMEFLNELREDAHRNKRDWQTRLDPYMHCLKDQGKISSEALRELLALASECRMPTPGVWELFSPLGWIFLGALSVLAGMLVMFSNRQVFLIAAVAAIMGGFWANSHMRRPTSQPPRPWSELRFSALMASGIVVAILAVFFVPYQTKDIVIRIAKERHEKNVAAFEKSEKGLLYLQKIAKDNFGVNVFLNDTKYSFKQTSMVLPGSSPASMNLAQGYCELNIDTSSLLETFGPENKAADPLAWIHTVLIHELAHCVDIKRDLPAIGTVGEIRKYSLAPSDAESVKDIGSYVVATQKLSTVVWREAFADIMAIGYVKLTVPNQATVLTSALRNKRVTSTTDVAHATTCWIDHAAQAAPPPSIKDLPTWSDDLRRTAVCGS